MTELPAAMQEALAAKQRRRRALAALPYADKLRILLRLQQVRDAIGETRGATARAWPIDVTTLFPSGMASLQEDAPAPPPNLVPPEPPREGTPPTDCHSHA